MDDPSTLPLRDAVAQSSEAFFAARNLAPLTRVNYRIDLREFVDHLVATHPGTSLTLATVDRRHLERFVADLDRRRLSGSSRRRKVATLRSFFAYLVRQGAIAHDPAALLIPPEAERAQPRVLTKAEYQRLREAVRDQTRDTAIIELFLQTGIRLSELARIRLPDLELPARATTEDYGALHVHGKGRKERTVTVNWKAVRALKAYQKIRNPKDGEEDRLFLTKFGKPMGPRAIEDVVQKYLHEAGIAGASAHSLRHTFATQHVRRGTGLNVVRAALGHESLKTTSLYVELAREQMDKELQQNAL